MPSNPPRHAQNSSRPLRRICVVEFGNAVASPMASRLLAEMGAKIVKIELPIKGDDSRHWGELVKGESPYFFHYNTNKKSCAIDVRSEEGKRIVYKLVKRSDVLIENFRPGTMKRLGLSFHKLETLNPRLIYCSISGFGQKGPYGNLAGYDVIIQGMSGLMSVTGEAGHEPLRVGVPIIDILTALYAAYSIMVAIFWREKTGMGQMIDLSLFDVATEAMGQWITYYSVTKKLPELFGNRYPMLAPYEPFKTKDKQYVIVGVGNEAQWRRFCELVGRPSLTRDERFATNSDRIRPRNRDLLSRILACLFIKDTSENWLMKLKEKGIPAGRINSIDKVITDVHLNKRRTFVRMHHPIMGTVTTTNVVPRFEKSPGVIDTIAPMLGENTREILIGLGYSNKQIRILSDAKVIFVCH